METKVILGFFSGLLLGWGNLRLIKYLVPKMLQEGSSARGHSIRFAAKIICLMGIVGFLILFVKVHPIAFVAGFSITLIPLLIKGVLHA